MATAAPHGTMADTTTPATIRLSSLTIDRQKSFDFQPFPFHRLPVEIRLMIYGLVFVIPTKIILEMPTYEPEDGRGLAYDSHRIPGKHVLPRGTMEMLLLNKTVSAEIRQILYSKNTFEINARYDRHWFSTIGVSNARCLRSIIADCRGTTREAGVRDLVAFHNTLVKRAPCLTDLGYSFPVAHGLRKSLDATMLLDVPTPWMRLRFLRSISMLVELQTDWTSMDGYDGHTRKSTSKRWLTRYRTKTAEMLEQTGLATKLANMAHATFRAGVAIRAENRHLERWLPAVEPETPRREPTGYPAIVMSSVKRHAVWKRKTLYKEKRKMEKEKRKMEKERQWREDEERDQGKENGDLGGEDGYLEDDDNDLSPPSHH